MGEKAKGNELRILNVVGNKPWGRRHGETPWVRGNV